MLIWDKTTGLSFIGLTVMDLKTSNGNMISSSNSYIEKFNRLEKKFDDSIKNFSVLMEENRGHKIQIGNIKERILTLEKNNTQAEHSSFEHDIIEE
jgi:predicted RND superfamily exporter protein